MTKKVWALFYNFFVAGCQSFIYILQKFWRGLVCLIVISILGWAVFRCLILEERSIKAWLPLIAKRYGCVFEAEHLNLCWKWGQWMYFSGKGIRLSLPSQTTLYIRDFSMSCRPEDFLKRLYNSHPPLALRLSLKNVQIFSLPSPPLPTTSLPPPVSSSLLNAQAVSVPSSPLSERIRFLEKIFSIQSCTITEGIAFKGCGPALDLLHIDGLTWETTVQKTCGTLQLLKGQASWEYHPATLKAPPTAHIAWQSVQISPDLVQVALGKEVKSPLKIDGNAQVTLAPDQAIWHMLITWPECILYKAPEKNQKIHQPKSSPSPPHLFSHEKGVLSKGTFSLQGTLNAMNGHAQFSLDQTPISITLQCPDCSNLKWSLYWKFLAPLPLTSLGFWWDPAWGPSAQKWVTTHFNLHKGKIKDLQGALTMTGFNVDSLKGGFFIQDATLSPLDSLPSIQHLSARTVFDLRSFHFTIQKALFSQQKVSSGTVKIQNLHKPLANFSLFLALKGPFANVVKILNGPRLRLLKDVPLRIEKGQADTKLSMEFPLLADLPLAQVMLTYTSQITDVHFHLPVLQNLLSYSKGRIFVTGSLKSLALKGIGKLSDLPTTWSWQNDFHRKASGVLKLQCTAHPAAWIPKRWHSMMFSPTDKPIPVIINYRPSSETLHLQTDLTHHKFSLPWIQYHKPEKKFLQIRGSVDLKHGTSDIHFHGDLPAHAQLKKSPQVPFFIFLDAPGRFYGYYRKTLTMKDLFIKAPFLDIGTLLDQEDSPPHPRPASSSLPKESVRVRLKIQHLKGLKSAIRKINGDLLWVQPKEKEALFSPLKDVIWQKGYATAQLGDHVKSLAALHVYPQKGKKLITFRADKLEALVGLFGESKHIMRGGCLLKTFQDPSGSYAGRIHIWDLKTRTPFLGKLLSLLSPTLFTEFFSNHLRFYSTSCIFHYKNQNFSIHNGVAKGINIGLFLQGNLDFKKNDMQLDGVLVPAYLFNTFFRHIPILGWILGQDKGLISSEFRVYGDIDDPHFGVYPLSLLSLGFLKNLFSPPQEGVQPLDKKMPLLKKQTAVQGKTTIQNKSYSK